MRVVLDTNVLVSGACYPDSICGRVLALVVANSWAVFSRELVVEMLEVIARAKLDKFAPRTSRLEVVASLLTTGETFALSSVPARCRDPKDDHILELANVAEADYIVTGDDDLLVLDPMGVVRIVSPAAFMSQMAQ